MYFSQLIRVLPVWLKELVKQYIDQVLLAMSETRIAAKHVTILLLVKQNNHWSSAKHQNTHFNTYVLIISESKETTI